MLSGFFRWHSFHKRMQNEYQENWWSQWIKLISFIHLKSQSINHRTRFHLLSLERAKAEHQEIEKWRHLDRTEVFSRINLVYFKSQTSSMSSWFLLPTYTNEKFTCFPFHWSGIGVPTTRPPSMIARISEDLHRKRPSGNLTMRSSSFCCLPQLSLRYVPPLLLLFV